MNNSADQKNGQLLFPWMYEEATVENPAHAQPDTALSDYQQRLLVALYCHYNTSACVEEMSHTAVMDALYQEFFQLTRSSLTHMAVSEELKKLEREGLLGVVSRCLKCNRPRCNVKAYLCPLCFDKIRGIRRSHLPPLVKPGSYGACGVQVGWHGNRRDEPSPGWENAIRCLEEPSS